MQHKSKAQRGGAHRCEGCAGPKVHGARVGPPPGEGSVWLSRRPMPSLAGSTQVAQEESFVPQERSACFPGSVRYAQRRFSGRGRPGINALERKEKHGAGITHRRSAVLVEAASCRAGSSSPNGGRKASTAAARSIQARQPMEGHPAFHGCVPGGDQPRRFTDHDLC